MDTSWDVPTLMILPRPTSQHTHKYQIDNKKKLRNKKNNEKELNALWDRGDICDKDRLWRNGEYELSLNVGCSAQARTRGRGEAINISALLRLLSQGLRHGFKTTPSHGIENNTNFLTCQIKSSIFYLMKSRFSTWGWPIYCSLWCCACILPPLRWNAKF